MLEALKRYQAAEAHKRETGKYPEGYEPPRETDSRRGMTSDAYMHELDEQWWSDTGHPALKAAFPDER